MKLRAVGKKRAIQLYEAAKNSVGCTDGSAAACMEIRLLLEDYEVKSRQYEEIMRAVESLCTQLPEVVELLNIKGIGLVTVASFLAETGDIRRFDSPSRYRSWPGLPSQKIVPAISEDRPPSANGGAPDCGRFCSGQRFHWLVKTATRSSVSCVNTTLPEARTL